MFMQMWTVKTGLWQEERQAWKIREDGVNSSKFIFLNLAYY